MLATAQTHGSLRRERKGGTKLIMRLLMNIPFKQKLNWIVMLTSSAALLLAYASFATYEFISYRRSMPVDLAVLATITGENAKSALDRNDVKFAEETLLASLAVQPQIMAAYIYRQDGEIFAKYVRADLSAGLPIPKPRQMGHTFANDYLELFQPIVSQDKTVGTLYLRSDLEQLYSRIRGCVGIGALVLLASVGVAWMLSAQVQRFISGPILNLAEITALVAEQKNYSVRVTKQSEDELGTLYDGFNNMLCEIERRDAALRQAQDDLEKRVVDRTADLTRANHSLQAEVAERQRAETALRISQNKFETLVNSIDGLVWEADPKTFEFTFVSQQAERLLGYPHEQWLSQPTFWQDHLHPDDRQRALEFFRQAVAESKSSHFEYRMIAADERAVWIRGSASVVVEGNEPVLLRGVWLDITEQKLAEQQLENLHSQLLETSRQAGMAEVATGVLHNVGNVLNSVNVSSTLVCDGVRRSRLPTLARTAAVLREHAHDLDAFFARDERGRMLPELLTQLADHLTQEQTQALKELESLSKNIEHIKDIIAMQQSYAKVSGVVESLPLASLLEDALQFNIAAFTRHGVSVVRQYEQVPSVTVDKHKVLQILINLMHNANYAMEEAQQPDKLLLLGIARHGNDRVRITVTDNGIGISSENLTRIFSHGFTTKKNGHGFGLHIGALAAKDMGGSLTAQSDGPGQGATFTLELPLLNENS